MLFEAQLQLRILEIHSNFWQFLGPDSSFALDPEGDDGLDWQAQNQPSQCPWVHFLSK